MKSFIIIIIVLLVSFYLFFYIYGLVIINKTKKAAKECGYTEEVEREYQNAIREWKYQEEQKKQEELRRAMERDAHEERS